MVPIKIYSLAMGAILCDDIMNERSKIWTFLRIYYQFRRATKGGRGEGGLPCPVLKIVKKCPDFGKKGPNCVSTWVESSIQNVALRVSRGKASKFFPAGPFFFCLWRKVYQSALTPQNLPCPKKVLIARLGSAETLLTQPRSVHLSKASLQDI